MTDPILWYIYQNFLKLYVTINAGYMRKFKMFPKIISGLHMDRNLLAA